MQKKSRNIFCQIIEYNGNTEKGGLSATVTPQFPLLSDS